MTARDAFARLIGIIRMTDRAKHLFPPSTIMAKTRGLWGGDSPGMLLLPTFVWYNSNQVPRTKPYHHGTLKQVLLAAAVELIGETGPAGLNLREVARRA